MGWKDQSQVWLCDLSFLFRFLDFWVSVSSILGCFVLMLHPLFTYMFYNVIYTLLLCFFSSFFLLLDFWGGGSGVGFGVTPSSSRIHALIFPYPHPLK